MRILFCGTILPERYETELKYLSSAANRFQWNMIKALREQGHEVVILSYVGFPLEGGREEDIVQSCRRTGIDVTIKKRNLLKAVGGFRGKLAKEIKKADSVWAYNVLYPWLDLGKLCSRNKKRSVLILADFSPAISYEDKMHKMYAGLQERSIRQFALVVGLSENVKGILKPIQKFMLMEGGIDISRYKNFHVPKYEAGQTLTLMYSGLLSYVTGVDLLLEAFSRIDNEQIRLVLTGKGDLEALIKSYEAEDKRIEYCGQLLYAEYLEKLRQAHILINPRNMKLPENQNNFPSKIMEYLACGRVIVSTKFVGWEKFGGKVEYCESQVSDIKKAIEMTCKYYESVYRTAYNENRKLAYNYAWQEQVNRIFGILGV